MRQVRAPAAALVVAALTAGQALAFVKGPVDARESSAVRIDTAGVDFRDPVSVKAFYARLQRSAMFVCGTSLDKDRHAQAADRACADAALKRAIDAINRPTLAAVHQQSGAPMLARGW